VASFSDCVGDPIAHSSRLGVRRCRYWGFLRIHLADSVYPSSLLVTRRVTTHPHFLSYLARSFLRGTALGDCRTTPGLRHFFLFFIPIGGRAALFPQEIADDSLDLFPSGQTHSSALFVFLYFFSPLPPVSASARDTPMTTVVAGSSLSKAT